MNEEAQAEPPDNVIEFKQRPENIPWDPQTENLVQKKQLTYLEHKHGPFLVDEVEREVTCKRCLKVIDPILAICLIADNWHSMDWKLKAYKEAEERVAAKYKLQKERQRLKQNPVPPSVG